MKRIEPLRDTPPGLAAYLEVDADYVSWDRFRSHEAGAAYRELRSTLIDVQHGLCGYCEARLVEPHVQVEHVVPQRDPDDGRRRELDETNMLASCLGGTKDAGDREQFLPPVKENTSCGPAKGGNADARFVDPQNDSGDAGAGDSAGQRRNRSCSGRLRGNRCSRRARRAYHRAVGSGREATATGAPETMERSGQVVRGWPG